MLTVIGTWEPGLHSDDVYVEWRMWRNVCRAFGVDRWIMVGSSEGPTKDCECYKTMKEALARELGQRVFLIPGSALLIGEEPMAEDAVFIFGNAAESNWKYIREGVDSVVRIDTPREVDLFGPTACGIALHAGRSC